MTIPELHTLFLEHPIVSTDTRKIAKNSIFFALKGDNFNGNSYASEALKKGSAFSVVDEAEFNTTDRHILVEDVLTTLQQLANYHRNYCSAKVIGLTGSNGKTTTKELVHSVLAKKYETIATIGNLNNHIGVPLTLLSIKDTTEIAIVEMGANHRKEITFLTSIAQPDFGYITNFGKAHLEGFGSVEGVIKGKSELYDYLIPKNKAVFLNADDPIQLQKLGNYINKFGFSIDNPQYYKIEFVQANPFVELKVEDYHITSRLVGSYNFTNCAAAVVMGKYFNVSMEDIKNAIEGYIPENNRSQIIEKNGHYIVLDAYNANPTSMEAALKNFRDMEYENKVVILGDMFELGETALHEHKEMARIARKFDFESVYLVGENFTKAHTDTTSFSNLEILSDYLEQNPLKKNSTILIKGSRGMALERLLDVL